jgi:TPP-dependent pyruvate/acetoin dehydrogenase alpha subunit
MSVPMLQTLDLEGHATGPAPDVPAEDLVRLFRHMLMMRVLDQRMLSLQRQGRIGFYGTAAGQEAAVTGSAYACAPPTGCSRPCARWACRCGAARRSRKSCAS